MKNRLFLKLFGIIIFFSTCTVLNKKQENLISAVNVYSKMPYMDSVSGKVFISEDSCTIYYLDDMVLYRVPHATTTYKNMTINKNGDTTNFVVDMDDNNIWDVTIRYRNHLFKTNEKKGLMYDSIMVDTGKVFDVAVFLNKNTNYRTNAFNKISFLNDPKKRLVNVSKDKKTNILNEKYASISKPDQTYSDSTYLYYLPQKQFKNVNFSLSEKVDSLKKRKFFQLKGIYNAVPKNDTQKVDYPRREIIFRINEVEVKNQDEIAAFFERFKKDSKLLK
jgi:hypothetical protein